MNRVMYSLADSDTENHHSFTVTRNKDPKTFSNFVDQVLSNVPVNHQKKKNSAINKLYGDLMSVIYSYGLINIHKDSKTKDSSGSEIDVTFYTEETRFGELVKHFSSTHKFRNGKVAYATTQEVAPQVTEAVEKINKRWPMECSPEMIKERDGTPYFKKPSIKPRCKCERKETTYIFKNQRVQKCFEESRKLTSDCHVKVDVSGKECRQHGMHDPPEQKPIGKKTYNAVWRQRSPKKSPSNTTRYSMEQALKHINAKLLRTPNGYKSIGPDQTQKSKTYTWFTAEGIRQDESSDSCDFDHESDQEMVKRNSIFCGCKKEDTGNTKHCFNDKRKSVRDLNSHEKKPLIKLVCDREKKETTYDNDLRNQRTENYYKDSSKLMSDSYAIKGVSDRYYRQHEIRDQKPVAKKAYHAASQRRSPKKPPSQTVRFPMEQSLNDASPKILRAPKEHRFMRNNRAQVNKTYSKFTKEGMALDKPSNYPHVYQRHAKSSEEEWAEKLEKQKCQYPDKVCDKAQKKPSKGHHFQFETNDSGARHAETFNSHMETHEQHSKKRMSPVRHTYSDCCAEGNVFLGDMEESTSGSNTSICTIYYDCESEYVKETTPNIRHKMDDFKNRKHHENQEKRKSGERRKIPPCPEPSPNVGLFKNSHKPLVKKSPREDTDHTEIHEVMKNRCHGKINKGKEFQPSMTPPRQKHQTTKVDMECFAKYHQRNKEHHHEGSLKNINSQVSPISHDELRSWNTIKSMVNEDAFQEFQRKYGKCLYLEEDLIPLKSFPREHFLKQIEEYQRSIHL